MAQHDFDTNVASRVEIDRLIELCVQYKEIISELHDLVQQLLGSLSSQSDDKP